jgi:2'-5' RNA ligase
VARAARGADDGAVADAAAALADYRAPQWRATSIDLVRSHLAPQPRYEVLRRIPLGEVGS